VAARKTERLLNLVICLLNTSRPITAAQIRAAVPGYPDSDEAFNRMFERDKSELREIGIPVSLEALSHWDDEFGYRIRPGDYALPDIELEPDEAAAIALAARVWQQASVAEAATGALLKLRAAGIETGDATIAGIEPLVTAPEAAFEPLWSAVRDRTPVAFDYQASGAGAATGRRVEPWGIVSWHGRWYVGGFDRDRGEARVFRLDRVRSDVEVIGKPGDVAVPSDVDVRAMVAGAPDDAPARTAALRVRRDTGLGLRRRATVVDTKDDYDVVEISFTSSDQLADEVAGYGADVVVDGPDDVRAAVVTRFRALAVESG
jgi:proteasome accessory factor B